MNKVITLILFLSVTFVNAQSSWKKIESKNYKAKTELTFRKTTPNTFDLYALDADSFQEEVNNNTTITIPINGASSKFYIKESSNFSNKLAPKYGNIKSFSLKGIDDKTATGKISIDKQGVHAIIFSGNHSTLYIDPYTKDKATYISYKKKDVTNATDNFTCLVEDNLISKETYTTIKTAQKTANDGFLRTYRLALACTVEYAAFHINNQGLSNTDSETEKQAAVLSAMNTTMARINGVLEKELSITLNIVLNSNGENELIFIDEDDLSNDNATLLLDESQVVCDNVISSENYDIGHTFSTGAGGLAYLGVLCTTGSKAGGVTGTSFPIGDSFDIDLVIHELGHQLGANHTFNGSTGSCAGGNRNSNTAVEPGSGSTIMAYAGICGSQNVQSNSDDYFHAVSIAQMWTVIQNKSCGTEVSTNNIAPQVNAGNDFFVPKSTPLILKGEATDEDGDSLTYCWEQIDNEIATTPPLSTNIAGASFRSLTPTNSPNRYLPALTTVVNGNTESEWEVIPSVAREMNFSLVVRDNNSNGGATDRDDMKITVLDIDPFIVTAPNTAVNWDVGTTETITWDKSTTDQAPINCENVRIKLSTDGGRTFPFTIAESTPNDGSYNITVPNQLTSSARIMIEGIDAVFYNVNTTNFAIISTGPTFVMSNISANTEEDLSNTKNTCNDNTSSITYNVNIEYINDFSETVSFSLDNLPQGVSASFSNNTITESGNLMITLTNFDTAEIGTYNITLNGNSTVINGSVELPAFRIFSDNFTEINLLSPTNNASSTDTLNATFQWNEQTNVLNYDLEVASDVDFNNIVFIEENINENSFLFSGILDWSTTHYWRVKPKNNCGEGEYSSTFSFTTEDAGYCNSSFTKKTESEFISNVTFGAINNDSGDDNLNEIADGYEDFTNISTPLILGETKTLSVTLDPVGGQDHCYVFIDWDGDTRFNTENERYDLGQHFTNVSTATSEILIPEDATLGETRMRIIIEYFNNGLAFGSGACDTDHNSGEFGETEDYTLNIIEAPSGTDDVFNNFSLFPNPIKSNLNIIFDVANTEQPIELNFSDTSGRIVKTFIYTTNDSLFSENLTQNDLQLQSGFYVLHIKNGNKETTKKLIIN